MNVRNTWLTIVLLAMLAGEGRAQGRRPPASAGQGPSVTVQLPTFHFFAVSTTVLVPDRGAAYLGGIGSSRTSRSARGIPLAPGGNVGIGAERAAAGMQVGAFVHDFQAMDEALLQQAAAMRSAKAGNEDEEPDVRVADRVPVLGVDEIRRRNAERADATEREAEEHFQKARELAAVGKSGVARIHYQMALRRATGDLKRQIAAELEATSGAAKVAAKR